MNRMLHVYIYVLSRIDLLRFGKCVIVEELGHSLVSIVECQIAESQESFRPVSPLRMERIAGNIQDLLRFMISIEFLPNRDRAERRIRRKCFVNLFCDCREQFMVERCSKGDQSFRTIWASRGERHSTGNLYYICSEC